MASVRKRSDRSAKPWQASWREFPGGPKKTKQFARKVLVGTALAVALVVEVAQHRRVMQNLADQFGEAIEALFAKQHLLVVHHVRPVSGAHETGREMVVPEHRHPLGQRARRPTLFCTSPW